MANAKIIEGHTTQWPIQKEQDKQHNGQYKTKRWTYNTMANTKRTGQETQWPI